MTRILVWLIMFTSCKASDKIGGNCEQSLDSSITTSWRYDSISKTVKANKSFLNELDSSKFDCLIGHDTSYVVQKFGRGYKISYDVPPKIKNRDSLYLAVSYPLYPPCPKNTTCDWQEFQFYFDSNGIIRKYGHTWNGVTVIK